jgi:hypothetical protein
MAPILLQHSAIVRIAYDSGRACRGG